MSDSHTGPLRRWRLSRPGRPISGPGAWFSRAPWIVLALAAGLLVLALVWPMPSPPVGESVTPPSVPRISERRTPVADRERILAALTTENIFAKDGRFWLAEVPPTTDGAPGTDPGGVGQAGAPTAPVAVLSSTDPLPMDIKPAVDNLRLVGIYTGTEGAPIAMFALASNLSAPTIQCTAGETFTDEKNPQAPWRVVEIDAVHDRVVLERIGKHVSLALYANEPIPVVEVPPPPAAQIPPDTSRPGVEVVRATEADILRDLRAAGIDEKDIAALTELIRKDPEAFARAQGATPGAPAQDQPSGLGEVLKLMQQASEKKDAPPPPDPPPSPPPPG